MATAAKAMTQYPGPRLVKKTGADIQIENGNYTRIHNHITEALMQVRLSGAERAVVDMILRQTYGYNRKAAQISYAEFERYLPYGRRKIMTALAKMTEYRIIHQIPTGDNRAHLWSFNKYHEQWRVDGDPVAAKLDIPKFGSSDLQITSLELASDLEITATSDLEITATSDLEITPLKEKKKQEKTGGKKAPRLTPQEHTLKQAAMTAMNAELEPKTRRELAEAIAACVGMSKLIEADDVALNQCHRSAIKVHEMGATVQDLRDWWNDWKRDYRSNGASLSQFEKFVSEQLEKHVPDTVITNEEPIFMGAAAPDPWTI